MDKKVVFRNVDIKKYIPMPIVWLILELMLINIFPDMPKRAEFVGGMTFALRIIMGGGIIIIFLYEFEFMVLRENKITVWQWLIPTIDVRVDGKPYVAATIKYLPLKSRGSARYNKNGIQTIDLSYDHDFYLFLSFSPITKEDYYYDPWKDQFANANMVNGTAINDKITIPKVRYCENYYNALVEYYGCEIGEEHIIDCCEKNVIL
ncbi:MAG: hypothetical protein IKM61_04005 [Eubacteriaceae bacterium]|nr:hypothetical protein [Eubacteriaceae bacterium]